MRGELRLTFAVYLKEMPLYSTPYPRRFPRMSIAQETEIICPACQYSFKKSISQSVNGAKQKSARTAILEGKYQDGPCPKCQKTISVASPFLYIDETRKQWISVFPVSQLGTWDDVEREAEETFSLAYGEKAPKVAQELGKNLVPRVVFGIGALREKLIQEENKLDDVAIELMKLLLIKRFPQLLFEGDRELRLDRVEGTNLIFAVTDKNSGATDEECKAPREMYDLVVNNPVDWEELHEQVSEGIFVDIFRLIS